LDLWLSSRKRLDFSPKSVNIRFCILNFDFCILKMEPTNNNFQSLQGIKLILRALRHRNYRLFFAGQGTSLIGTWMQQVAMGWLVYQMSNSPFYLGVVGFASQIPTLLITPFAGVLADRLDRRPILILTAVLSMLQAIALAVLVLTGHIAMWQIIALSIFIGLVNAFDIPTRQSFIFELLDNQEDLPNAIALNSMIFNGARLIGPPIAGIVIELAGEGACFIINAASFLAVLAALLAMRIVPRNNNRHPNPILAELKEGVAYAYKFIPVRTILILLSFISLVAMPYAVLMPVFARDILHGGPQTLGFLTGAIGVGALVGAIFLAARKTVQGLGRILVMAVTVFGAGILAFSFSQILWLSLALMLLTGFGLMVHMVSINTILQTIVDDDKRGRIMSLYTMAFMGLAPFGSLLAGGIADIIGAPRTLQASGVLCLIAAIIFWRKLPRIRQEIHPIYIRKGIIPQVATGLGAVTQLEAQTKE
jgi:MFS family permease